MQWLYSEKTAMLSVILFSIWKGIGYNIILFWLGFKVSQNPTWKPLVSMEQASGKCSSR